MKIITNKKKELILRGLIYFPPQKKPEISDFWIFGEPKINSKIGQNTF